MIDDIVTRLRNECDSKNCWCPMLDERCIYMEAADEIKRLREELKQNQIPQRIRSAIEYWETSIE
jgi:hypothetical protein